MPQPDLIFDVGLHLGEDTDFYLKLGFRVVAFEANPEFVRHCKERFSDQIAAGRLRIIEGAIAGAPADRVPFFINAVETQWGTCNPDWAARNAVRGAPSTEIEVPRIDMLEAFETWGIPHYLKVDIEGSDTLVLRALLQTADRPQYVSFETDITGYGAVQEEIALLKSAGYSKFQPVQQETISGSKFSVRAGDGSILKYRFENGASGPFGEYLPGTWLDFEQCLRAYRRIFWSYRLAGHKSPFAHPPLRRLRPRIQKLVGVAGWHDLHAALS
jgi:FkbM family methyltransferase